MFLRIAQTVLCGLVFILAAHSQAPAKPPLSSAAIPDAVTADGQHYSVILENECVRVLRIHYGPHERGNMHNHPHSVTVFLTDGLLRMTFPDGKSIEAPVKQGQTVFEEAGPHQPENLSDKPFEAIRTELKDCPKDSKAAGGPMTVPDLLEGKLQVKHVSLEKTSYEGRKAVRVTSLPADDAAYNMTSGTGGGVAVLAGSKFHNGVIEFDVAARPQPTAPPLARGFVGLAFRVPPDASKYDYVYIRPTNGRADDQERRNHSTQYASFPDYEWLKLRKDFPGKYESYVDLVPGEWTHLRIEVDGIKMRLYVNRAEQPTLLVNDLKQGDGSGALALWIGVGTEAYFSGLTVTPL